MIEDYLNINSFFDYKLYNPLTKTPITQNHLSNILGPSLAEFEFSKKTHIQIPEPVLRQYERFRPTSLFRARKLEQAISTDCEIYIKDESESPSGTHKMNSAYLIAHLIKKDGIQTLTTETTGNWGLALAKAAKEYSLNIVCFLDSESASYRSSIKNRIEDQNAQVVIVDHDNQHGDLLTLSADAAIEYTKSLNNAAYIFGSVLGYFLIPQSIVGTEAKHQLDIISRYPDIIVGSCGGGANLMGISAAFIEDIISDNTVCKIISVESENCPILTSGRRDLFSIDTLDYYPCLLTYGLDSLMSNEYIGGLGSTIVASSAYHFHSTGIIEGQQVSAKEANDAADIFFTTQNIRVALESGYQLAGVIREARDNHGKVILTNISSPQIDLINPSNETDNRQSCLV